ncbi:hypothetical protein [Verminephrobacter aporrectodeae]|uniref:hypothetical protein n=1 Tax=Verminephrobacter aporrectodeae TaxID=1110389 RepID=UPI00223825EE|nr:hypothetical protein [Verminephrobacter aporrectodeae]
MTLSHGEPRPPTNSRFLSDVCGASRPLFELLLIFLNVLLFALRLHDAAAKSSKDALLLPTQYMPAMVSFFPAG